MASRKTSCRRSPYFRWVLRRSFCSLSRSSARFVASIRRRLFARSRPAFKIAISATVRRRLRRSSFFGRHRFRASNTLSGLTGFICLIGDLPKSEFQNPITPEMLHLKIREVHFVWRHLPDDVVIGNPHISTTFDRGQDSATGCDVFHRPNRHRPVALSLRRGSEDYPIAMSQLSRFGLSHFYPLRPRRHGVAPETHQAFPP